VSDPGDWFGGKQVLITGGSSGIGLALARRVAGLGAGVTLVARGQERLGSAAGEIRGLTSQPVRTLALDISDREAVAERAFAEAVEQPVDVLVNSAGIATPARFLEADPDDLYDQMNVNYFGAVWMCRALLRHLIERKGHVVNMGSTASLIGVYGYSGYTPPKFALYGLSEVLRAELAPRGVGVTIVLPGSTQTPMLDGELEVAPAETRKILTSNPVLTPEQVADATVQAVARGRFEVVPGLVNRISTRAYRLAPSVGRRVLDREARSGARGSDR
jgi:3-dehydrosphinganine reductase